MAANAKLLSDAFVNGIPQQPSRRPDKNELLIRLPAKPGENAAFPVRFVYEVPSPRPGRQLGWRGTFTIAPPKLSDVEVLQTKSTLYLPNDYRFVKFGGGMREETGRRGWERARRMFTFFLPQVGPAPLAAGQIVLNEPPAVPPVQQAGFDTEIQKEGVPVVLRRLDEPDAVRVSYRGKAYAATVEAMAFAFVFFLGVMLILTPRLVRFAFFMLFAVGGAIVAGAVNPRGAGFWEAIAGGALAAAVVWLICGFWRGADRWVGRGREKLRERQAARKAAVVAVPPKVHPVVEPSPPDPESPPHRRRRPPNRSPRSPQNRSRAKAQQKARNPKAR